MCCKFLFSTRFSLTEPEQPILYSSEPVGPFVLYLKLPWGVICTRFDFSGIPASIHLVLHPPALADLNPTTNDLFLDAIRQGTPFYIIFLSGTLSLFLTAWCTESVAMPKLLILFFLFSGSLPGQRRFLSFI